MRPYPRIFPTTVTPAIRAQADLEVRQGVIVIRVAAGSPAAQAGLEAGDVIVAADGQPVTTESELRRAIESHKVGDTMELTVVRNGQQRSICARLAEAPSAGP